MNITIENSIEQLRTLIDFVDGGDVPQWYVLPKTYYDHQSMRSGIARILKWLRVMAMSNRLQELQLTNQPWSEVVRSIANANNSFLLFNSEKEVVMLHNDFSCEQIKILCHIALKEFSPRLMS